MQTAGHHLTSNSTATPLAGAGTFTGTTTFVGLWGTLIVSVFADVAGSLFVEFSTDGNNFDSSVEIPVAAGGNEFHRFTITRPYARVRYVNGSSAQSTFRLSTLLGLAAPPLTSTLAGPVTQNADALVVRPTDWLLQLARGHWTGIEAVRVFGFNPDVDTSEEDIWNGTGLYSGWLTAESTVRIASGGSANDDASGSGAQSVRVEGLDENWQEVSEDIATAGASASSATTTTFIRVFRAYVLNVGTYGGANDGAIVIEETGASGVMAQIDAGVGESKQAVYTIPLGKTGFLHDLEGYVDGSKTAEFRLNTRANADDASTPFTSKRVRAQFEGIQGQFHHDFHKYIELPEKTDVWLSAIGPSGTPGVSGQFEIFLMAD